MNRDNRESAKIIAATHSRSWVFTSATDFSHRPLIIIST